MTEDWAEHRHARMTWLIGGPAHDTMTRLDDRYAIVQIPVAGTLHTYERQTFVEKGTAHTFWCHAGMTQDARLDAVEDYLLRT